MVPTEPHFSQRHGWGHRALPRVLFTNVILLIEMATLVTTLFDINALQLML